jgi:GntR family transcriptional repressor for pyruvate dehydrogenase complex
MQDGLALYCEIPLTREQLPEQIADAIQSLVVAQKLTPDERLPPERELAKALNVSRPTLREALRLLQSRGLVERKPGSGTYVRQMSPAPIIKSVESFFLVSDCSYSDLMQVRLLLEPCASALAATQAAAEDLGLIDQRLEAIEAAFDTGDSTRLAAADAQFHMEVARISGNRLLAAMEAAIDHLVREWTRVSASRVFDRHVMEQHRGILAAIRAHEPEAAQTAMSAHIRGQEGILQKALRGSSGSKQRGAADA